MEEIKNFQSGVKEVGVLVIGGGIAGLVAARDLSLRSTSVLLIESSPSLGGSISKISLQGVEVDAGAESFAISRSDALELIQSLGISDQLIAPTRSDARIQLLDGALPIPHGIL